MKKRFVNIMCVFLAFLLVGCGNESDDTTDVSKDGSELTLGYTVQTLNNPYFTTLTNSFEEYGKEKGIKTLIADGDQDPSEQISQVENFISQNVDGIAIAPADETALISAVEQAKAAGIPVVATNQNIEGVDAFITVPEYEYGYTIGEVAADWINEYYPEGVDVLVLDYPEIESIIARGDGIRDAIIEIAPSANIVASISANTPENGMAAMEATLQKHPNVEVVVGVNDAGVLGAYEAVKAANKETENFFMGGLDATDQALELISEDTIFRATVDINPEGTGDLIIETILEVIANGPIEDVIAIDMIPVTLENIDEFLLSKY